MSLVVDEGQTQKPRTERLLSMAKLNRTHSLRHDNWTACELGCTVNRVVTTAIRFRFDCNSTAL